MPGIATKLLIPVLRASLRPTGRVSRFALDTYVTPSLYLTLNRLLVQNPAVDFNEFEQTLLGAVHPSKIPIETLESNIRFRTWVRTAYLEKRFGSWPSIDKQDKDAQELWREAKETVLRPDKLCARDSLETLFGLQSWNTSPDADEDSKKNELIKTWHTANQPDGSNVDSTKRDAARAEVSQWGLEQVLESVGCCIYGMNEYNLFCERHNLFDVLTTDYVDSLAKHILSSARRIKSSPTRVNPAGSPIVVLEVGAGSGRMSHMLRSRVNDIDWISSTKGTHHVHKNKEPKRRRSTDTEVEIVATDSGVWRLQSMRYPVTRMDYVDALKRFKPDIVVCSWMPMGDDWTSAFRAQKSVQEYILIGETDGGCCGHPWRTWGYRPTNVENEDVVVEKYERPSVDIFDMISRVGSEDYWKSKEEARNKSNKEDDDVPPFVKDGFKRENVVSASMHQWSRYDRATCASNSKTVSFSK